MLWSLAVLVACQAAGELLHALWGLPGPGAVLGIGILLFVLRVGADRLGSSAALPAADGLLSYLPLFFVPPGVSTVMQIGQLAHVWPAVLLGLVASSILALVVTGRVTQALLARRDTPAEGRQSPVLS
jgi:holin-like protein